jgi:hypothetical protein
LCFALLHWGNSHLVITRRSIGFGLSNHVLPFSDPQEAAFIMKVALSFLVWFVAAPLVAGVAGGGGRDVGQDCDFDTDPNGQVCKEYCNGTPLEIHWPKCCGFHGKHCPNTKGDPHFATWNGSKFDFHGECDLVFVHSPAFHDGLGLDIHVRTKIVRTWSYIDVAVVKIGKDVLEYKGSDDEHYWINKVVYDGTASNKIGDFNIEYKRTSSKQREMNIDIGDGHRIEIKSYKTMVGVTFVGGTKADFDKSVGLTGEFGTGRKLGRDGREISDANEFGQEWQVRAEDGLLFRTLEGPQFPLEQCKMPSSFQGAERHRRLGETTVKVEAAEKACADKIKDPEEFENCVFDVLLTNDIGIAGAY